VPRVKTVFSPNLSPYRAFSREEWASLRADAPLTLNAQDVVQLQSLNDPISIQEVEAIYLPLSRLLSLHVTAMQRLFKSRSHFLGVEDVKMPFIIGIAGSVSSGKSTTSRILKAQLVDEGLMEKKGFPESYDIAPLLAFLSDVKAGKKATASIYSHLIYDRVEGQGIGVDRPDILIVEGLNVLQTGRAPKGGQAIPFVSDFFDFSIYIDAEEALLEKWYVERFLRLRETAFKDPTSYFKRYALLSDEAACETALHLWRSINLVNLHDNILPTRQRADLILKKGAAHLVENVQLRRL
jgi:type I pantothenate kinase